MKLHPRVTRPMAELVKRFEGLRRTAARLPDGGWTVGYGHELSAREGAVVTPEDAEALLLYDLSQVAAKLEAWTFTPLNQNQFEALSALAFNIGLENFKTSTVLKRVNEGQHLLAATAFELWRRADIGGESLVIDALVRRRAAEKAHYLTPPEGFRPSPTPVLRPTFDEAVVQAALKARLGSSPSRVPPKSPAAPPPADAPFPTGEAAASAAPMVPTSAPGPGPSARPRSASETGSPVALSSRFAYATVERAAVNEAPPQAVNDGPFGQFIPFAPGLELLPTAAAKTMAQAAPSETPEAHVVEETAPPPIEVAAEIDAEAPFALAVPILSVAPREAFGVRTRLPEPLSAEGALAKKTAAGRPIGAAQAFNKTLFYGLAGAFGGVLILAAWMSILVSKASAGNLFAGLAGLFLATSSALYFLRRLSRPRAIKRS